MIDRSQGIPTEEEQEAMIRRVADTMREHGYSATADGSLPRQIVNDLLKEINR